MAHRFRSPSAGIRVEVLEDRDVSAVDLLAVGAGEGGGPAVRAYNSDGTLRYSFFAYTPSFSGGVAVATGDLTGDGVDDIVAGAGLGGGPHVKVFDGVNGEEISSFFAYENFARGGVWVAVSDVDGDGRGELVTGAGYGGGPHVKVFRLQDLAEVASFYAFAPEFTGSVRVAAADLDGDGMSEVVAGAGPGGRSEVRVFAGGTLLPVSAFEVFDPRHRGGVWVAATDAISPGLILVGAGRTAKFPFGPVVGPTAAVFEADGTRAGGTDVFASGFLGGVRVAGLAGDPVFGAGPGGGPAVRVLRPDGSAIFEFFAFDPGFTGGVFVG